MAFLFGRSGKADSPGLAAVREVCAGFAALSEVEKRALAEILVRVVPSLAKEGATSALPVERIGATLKAAIGKAWVGIVSPGPAKLLAQIAEALEHHEVAAGLRAFCAAVAAECKAEGVAGG